LPARIDATVSRRSFSALGPASALGLVLLEHPLAEHVVIAEQRHAEHLAQPRQGLAFQRLLGDDRLAYTPQFLVAEPSPEGVARTDRRVITSPRRRAW